MWRRASPHRLIVVACVIVLLSTFMLVIQQNDLDNHNQPSIYKRRKQHQNSLPTNHDTIVSSAIKDTTTKSQTTVSKLPRNVAFKPEDWTDKARSPRMSDREDARGQDELEQFEQHVYEPDGVLEDYISNGGINGKKHKTKNSSQKQMNPLNYGLHMDSKTRSVIDTSLMQGGILNVDTKNQAETRPMLRNHSSKRNFSGYVYKVNRDQISDFKSSHGKDSIRKPKVHLLDSLRENYHDFNLTSAAEGYLIDTPGCKISDVDPFDSKVRRFIVKVDVKCKGLPPLVTQENNHLVLHKDIIDKYYGGSFKECRYQEIFRGPCGKDQDSTYDYSPLAVDFKDSIPWPQNVEFMRVLCENTSGVTIHENYFNAVPKKQNVEKRCNLADEKSRPDVKERLNVLIVGLDALSRLNFIRQMPITYRYLVEKLNAIQLKGYNKVADNTLVNVFPMLTGKFAEELGYMDASRPLDAIDFIWKKFSASGYRTLLAEDAPYMATFNYLREGFKKPPVDYYLRPFSMAVDMSALINSSTFHCVGKRLELEIVLDYIYKLADTFKTDSPYFAFGWNARISHDSLNLPRVADKPYADFIRKLHASNYLNNTVLLIASDHGLRYGHFLKTYMGKLEERLPAMFMVFPPWVYEKYPEIGKNLRRNQHKLTTPFDIHETLIDIMHFRGSPRPVGKVTGKNGRWRLPRGISLMSEIPEERTCKDAEILPHWCTCQNHRPILRNDTRAVNAAKFLVFTINKQLAKHSNLCAKLKFTKLVDAMLGEENTESLTARVVRSEKDDHETNIEFGEMPHFKSVYLLLTVETQPGKALFEATVKYMYSEENESYEVTGDISRINQYGKTSSCIVDYTARKFCYCNEFLTPEERINQRRSDTKLPGLKALLENENFHAQSSNGIDFSSQTLHQSNPVYEPVPVMPAEYKQLSYDSRSFNLYDRRAVAENFYNDYR